MGFAINWSFGILFECFLGPVFGPLYEAKEGTFSPFMEGEISGEMKFSASFPGVDMVSHVTWATLDYTRTSGAGGDIFIYGEWFVSNEKRRLRIMAHEYFHAIQHYGIPREGASRFDVVRQNGLYWLLEGSAVYVEVRTGAHEGLLEYGESSFAEAKAWRTAQVRETAAPLQSLETQEAVFAVGDISYPLGFMATDFLVDNFGGLPALFLPPLPLGEG